MSRQHHNDMEIDSLCDREKDRSSTRTRLAVLLILLLGSSVFLLLSVAFAAERRQMQLTLRQATALALQNNLNIQIAGLTPQIREAQVTEQKGIFDVELRSALTTTDRQLLDTSATLRTADDA